MNKNQWRAEEFARGFKQGDVDACQGGGHLGGVYSLPLFLLGVGGMDTPQFCKPLFKSLNLD